MDIEDQCQFVVMSTLLVIFRRQLDDPNMTPKCPDLPLLVGHVKSMGQTLCILEGKKLEGNAEDTDYFFSSRQTRDQVFFLIFFYKSYP